MTHDVTRPWVVTHDVSYVELSTQGNAHTHHNSRYKKKGATVARREFLKSDIEPTFRQARFLNTPVTQPSIRQRSDTR